MQGTRILGQSRNLDGLSVNVRNESTQEDYNQNNNHNFSVEEIPSKNSIFHNKRRSVVSAKGGGHRNRYSH